MMDGIKESKSLLMEAKILASFLSSCQVNPDGLVLETRQLVERIDGVKIEIYANEHPPPHFHVIAGDKRASFSIETGELLEGSLDKRGNKIVEYYHTIRKQNLIDIWNKTRPDGCVVGRVRQQHEG